MKQKKWKKAIAALLVSTMAIGMAAPSAAAFTFNEDEIPFLNWLNSFFSSLTNGSTENWWDSSTETETEAVPETDTVVDEEVVYDNTEMEVVEDASTVENGEMLRASTYALRSTAADTSTAEAGVMPLNADDGEDLVLDSETTLKYFGVTLYNYTAETINKATKKLEYEASIANGTTLDTWNGIYFNDGNPSAETYEYIVEAGVTSSNNITYKEISTNSGTYFTDSALTNSVSVISVENGTIIPYEPATVYCYSLTDDENLTEYVTNYYYKVSDGNYQQLYVSRSSEYTNKYVTYTYTYYYGTEGNLTQCGSQEYDVYYWGDNDTTTVNIPIYKKGEETTAYLYSLVGSDGTTLASNTEDTASTNYTLYYEASAGTGTTDALPFANWNHWDKDKDNATGTNGDLIYTGLVASNLDAQGNIVFLKPDAGIFNSDTTVKNIYTNVQVPFVYSGNEYVFDAAQNGVYFKEDSTQGSDAVPTVNTDDGLGLYFDKGNTQSNGVRYADIPEGETATMWLPFNSATDIDGQSACDYHFGMKATVPFTMSANGKADAGNDTSEDIIFDFSGDDDVWVFIDGKLIIDLGGIHNKLNAVINFAQNTVTYSEANAADTDTETGSVNDNTFSTTQYLFNDTITEEGTETAVTGLLGMDRTTFAANTSHELTIFYLERGGGSSNSKIRFNLPVYDEVSVTKKISGVASYDAETKTVTPDDSLDGLTADQISALNEVDFGFTLYKNGEPVANQNYVLLNIDGQIVDAARSTDADGHFILKNNQTAKFIIQFSTNDPGDSYYVVEDVTNGFVYTIFDITGGGANTMTTAAEGASISYTYGEESGAYYITDTDAERPKSYTATLVGGSEAEDTIHFTSKNYVNISTPTPFAIAFDETIVIDYGLPVQIDLTNNAYIVGNTSSVSVYDVTPVDGVYTGTYGTYTIADGYITYTLNQQLTGIEVIPFRVTAYASAEGGAVSDDSETAYIYIIPATTMYYEENFGLVTYTGSNWQADLVTEPAYINTLQEPGVVGTVGDSTYGSDTAYLNDSHDSNGTSKYAVTTNGAVSFTYTFTGTGTSFYARVANTTGYMKVDVYELIEEEDGTKETFIQGLFRDTVYDSEESVILYNVPVFTSDELPYGTYKVSVIVAKENANNGYNKDFWFDGIRVYQPLNIEDPNVSIAEAAYTTDGEAHMTHLTLRKKLISDAVYSEVYEKDEEGNFILDENGEKIPVYEIDEDGNIIYDDEGNPIQAIELISGDNSEFAVFTDTNGEIVSVDEYVSIGPKEEVYLNEGQAITFTLKNWDANTNKLYLGIKAPKGSGEVNVGSQAISISNAVDCFYDITNYGIISGINTDTITYTIKATKDLISVTTIKVTGDPDFEIVANVDEEG